MTTLKYGENPQQWARIQFEITKNPLAVYCFHRLDGMPFADQTVSANSLKDWNRAIRILAQIQGSVDQRMFPRAAVIVKHGNPCGAAVGSDDMQVLRNTCRGDSEAAFGGFLVTNFPLTKRHAQELSALFTPVILAGVAAPAIDVSLIPITQRKINQCHVIENGALKLGVEGCMVWPDEVSAICGATLTQGTNQFVPAISKLVRSNTVKNQLPAHEVERDIMLGAAVCTFSTSNTITIIKDGALIGNGCGQQKRKLAARVALMIADEMGHAVDGATVVRDGFFSHVDAIDVLGERGVKVIFAPSGSRSDTAIFSRAKDYDIAMYTIPTDVGRMFYGH